MPRMTRQTFQRGPPGRSLSETVTEYGRDGIDHFKGLSRLACRVIVEVISVIRLSGFRPATQTMGAVGPANPSRLTPTRFLSAKTSRNRSTIS